MSRTVLQWMTRALVAGTLISGVAIAAAGMSHADLIPNPGVGRSTSWTGGVVGELTPTPAPLAPRVR